jgi:predicted O-methyltransferase YrrM
LGVTAVQPATGAALRVLAAVADAKAIAEVGTGTGVSGLYLLRGMRSDGVLTSIDTDQERQRAARRAFMEAQVPPGRYRLIAGRGLEVLPRLADRAYDLVLVDANRTDLQAYVMEALRLLRQGGLLCVEGAFGGGRIADPSARDPAILAAREAIKTVREDDGLVSAVLPVGGGLLVAARR